MANRYTVNTVRITGAKEFQAKLRQMQNDAQTDVIMAGVVEAAKPIKSAMVVKCPVRTDQEIKVGGRKLAPGEMRLSIRAKVVGYPANAVAVGIIGPTGRAKRVAHLVEYGHLATSSQKGQTIRRGTARAARNGRTHVPAHPFIRPAVLTTVSAQAAAFSRAVEIAIVKSATS